MNSKATGPTRRQLLGTAATAGMATVIAVHRPAHAAEPIRIGFAMSLTGPGAGAGKMMLVGREIWKEEINTKGGLLGRPVQFVYYDDQSNPGNVPGLYAKLIDLDRVDLLCSSFGTNQIAPAMPIVMSKNMVYMGLFGTGVNDTFHYDRYFQILPNGPEGNRSLSVGFFEAACTISPAPRTVALAGEDTEFGQNILAGARANVARLGLQVVYDRNFPASTVDHAPVVRAIQSATPDLVFVASYPVGSVGMVRAMNEVGFTPRMFGGAMIGLSFTAIKAQLGPLLNGIVINENYVPEPTMNFPGIETFLEQYQSRAKAAGADPLGFWSPFAYAELQILGQAVAAVGTIDQARLADYRHRTQFSTIVGDVKFGADGEWEESRILFVQYRNIQGNDVNQFRQPGKAVILYPPGLAGEPVGAPAAEATPPHLELIGIATAIWKARALYAAAHLGLADLLAGGPQDVAELAADTGTHAPSLHRLLRALASLGVLTETEPQCFALTRLGAALRQDAVGAARSTVLTLAGNWQWQAWSHFLASLTTGGTGLAAATGQELFAYLADHPHDGARFDEAMIGLYSGLWPSVAAAWDFSPLRSVADIGGGVGLLLAEILSAHPHMRGLLLDRAATVTKARQVMAGRGLTRRCEIATGDFFAAVPPGHDAYLLAHVLHDWGDAQCLSILHECRKAMHRDARLLIVETVLPNGGAPHPGKLLDLVMLTVTGGRERTEQEFAELLRKV